MSMITLNGTLINIFESPKGVSKDGDEYGGQHKIQLLADMELKNGQVRKEMLTLTAPDIEPFKKLVGASVSVPAGVFLNGKALQWFIPKNANLGLLRASQGQ